jgi:glyoxylase-like metal-dependent hydrolase (beta-lactamase superfamily II)
VAPEIDVQDALEDGQPFRIDDDVLVAHHTPGHAHGHLCFEEPRSRTMIAGDMVAGWGTIAVVPPEGDMAQYLASLERLKAASPGLLLPAHGPPIGGAVAKLDEYLSHRRAREAQVLEALDRHPASPAELVEQIYVGLPQGLAWAAQCSIQAHLDKLEAEGRVARGGDRYRRIG